MSTIASKPSAFDFGAGFDGNPQKQPQWGTCPQGPLPPPSPSPHSSSDANMALAFGTLIGVVGGITVMMTA